jgi:hypothetical protein
MMNAVYQLQARDRFSTIPLQFPETDHSSGGESQVFVKANSPLVGL